MSTEQLRALRDEAQVEKEFQNTQHSDNANVLWLAAMQTVSLCDRAIAALVEAEGAKACEQPARTAVPPMPPRHTNVERHRARPAVHQLPDRCAVRHRVSAGTADLSLTVYSPTELLCNERDVQQIIAAATAIAAERDTALERAEKAETKAKQAEYGEQDAEHTADENYRLRVQAERERDEARAQAWEQAERTESARAELAALKAYRDQESRRNRCRAQKAEAEIAMLKAQEPVAWWWIEDGVMHEPSIVRMAFGLVKPSATAKPLYPGPAAPVASIPLAQHEAALAEARRDERERCAKVCEGLSDLDLYVRESSALMEAGAAIRALRDGEG